MVAAGAVSSGMAARTSANLTPSPDPAEPSFEEAMAQVEAIVQRIESGEIGLEQSLSEYEKGLALLKRCRGVLDRVEQKITDLTAQMQGEKR